MRALLLILMMALLPLRGWAGNAMAVQQLQRPGPAGAAQAVAQPGQAAPHAAHGAQADLAAWATGSTGSIRAAAQTLPCHATGAETRQAQAPDLAQAGFTAPQPAELPACSDCQMCQICHGAGLTHGEPGVALLALTQALVQAPEPGLTQPPEAAHFKPPISS